jgi:hypothetical protein
MSTRSTKRCRTELRAVAVSLLLFAGGPVSAQTSGEPIELEIPPVSGEAGDAVEISVVLHTHGQEVAGIQIDVEAYPPLTIQTTDGGGPDCWRNLELDKDYTVYSFPDGQWNRMRALVLSLSNVTPIPDGSLLFTCRIDIDAAAEAGEYQVSALRLGGSTSQGDPLDAVGSGGSILVADPVEGLASLSADTHASGGCAIQAGGRNRTGWLLLMPALLLWRRRRSR